MTKKYTERFQEMKELYIADPTYAVRSKKFIGLLEKRILNDIWESLSDKGKSILRKEHEVEIFQDSKNKNVDRFWKANSHGVSGQILQLHLYYMK